MGRSSAGSLTMMASSGVVLVFVFVGCLFPSFDQVETGNGDAVGSSGGTSSGKSSSGSTASSSSSSGSSSSSSSSTSSSSGSSGASSGATSSGSTSSSGADASSGAVAQEIACAAEICPIPAQFCCTTIGGPGCQNTGTESFCDTIEGGDILRCDGAEDCSAGQTCCFTAAKALAECVATPCAGQELCNGPAHACSSGKTCSGTVSQGHRACQ